VLVENLGRLAEGIVTGRTARHARRPTCSACGQSRLQVSETLVQAPDSIGFRLLTPPPLVSFAVGLL
jgi:hypothetical protein